MQSVGFVYALLPFFRRFFPDKEQRREALLRHFGFFNTHPYMISVILGVVASMEKDIADKQLKNYAEIDTLKTNMAGPLAAIGDTFFWATWRPFTTLLGISIMFFFYDAMTFRGTWLAPLFFLASFNLIHLSFRYWSMRLSYHLRTRMIRILAGLEFQRAVDMLRYAGLAVLSVVALYYTFGLHYVTNEKIIFLLVFLLSIALGCLRVPAVFIFYFIVLLSIIIRMSF